MKKNILLILTLCIAWINATAQGPIKNTAFKSGETRMYDMYFTSYQKNFAISHMIVEDKVILGYTENDKCDCRACEEHLQTMLKQSGFKDMTIRISDKLEHYCEQLQKLNDKEQSNNPEKDDEARIVLYDISL